MSTTNNQNQKKRPYDDENYKGPLTPKRLFCGPDDPDVILVIGGKETMEHSRFLCSWSDYFRGALRSGMQEAQTRRFEFPDRDMEEWIQIKNIMNPFSGPCVTASNVEMALSWFDELCVPEGVEHCDEILSMKGDIQCECYYSCHCGYGEKYGVPAGEDNNGSNMNEKRQERFRIDRHLHRKWKGNYKQTIELLSTSLRYNLSISKPKYFSTLRKVWMLGSFLIEKEHLEPLIKIFAQYEESVEELWDLLGSLSPMCSKTDEEEKGSLIGNPLLISHVLAEKESAEREKKLKKEHQRELKNQREEHKKELENLKEKYEEELKKLREKNESDCKAKDAKLTKSRNDVKLLIAEMSKSKPTSYVRVLRRKIKENYGDRLALPTDWDEA